MATNKQLIERWQNVLRVLRALTPHQRKKHWDMGTWGVQTECGTVACAAGHCSLDPWFRRRGFTSEMVQSFFAGTGVLAFTGHRIDHFFGAGAINIFWNDKRRPVSAVIREVRSHIRKLEAQS